MKKILILLLMISAIKIFASDTKQDSRNISKRKFYKLQAVKIVAKKPEEAIGYMDVLSLKSLKEKTKITLDETLDKISGLDVSVGGKNGSFLSIRGFNENEIKILIDGQPISPAYMDAVDLTTLPLENIKEIQVLKGPVSSIYGADTMGGVINIITNEPIEKNMLKIGTLFRRNNTNKVYASIAKKIAFSQIMITLSRFHTDGLVLSKKFIPTDSEDGKVKENDSRTSYNLISDMDFHLSDFHQLGLKFSYNYFPDKEITPKVFERKYSKFLDWKRYHLGLSGHFQLRYDTTLEAILYYDRQSDTYAQYQDKDYQIMESGWPSYLISATIGSNFKIDKEISGNWLLTNGIRFENAYYKRKDYAHYINWTSNNSNLIYYFLQNKFLFGKLTLTMGNGFSYYFLNNYQNKKYHLEPSAGLYYKISNSAKISFASGINTKYPTLRQLFGEIHGNKNLSEESAWKNELTVEKTFTNALFPVKSDIVIFYNKIKNLIKVLGDTNQNIAKIDSYGFETNILFTMYELENQIKYSFVKYSGKSDIKLLSEPENKLTVTESFGLPCDFKVSYKFLWKDKRRFLYDNKYVILPSYALHSIYFSKKYRKFNFSFAITNIFDKNYQMQYGYPGEGINFNFLIETKL